MNDKFKIARRHIGDQKSLMACVFLATQVMAAHAANPGSNLHGSIHFRNPSTGAVTNDSGYTMNVGDTANIGTSAECTDSDGNDVPDTVTFSVTGDPTTGGAKSTFYPNPAATNVQVVLTVVTTKDTDAQVYNLVFSGVGVVCGQYTYNPFALTVDPVISLSRKDLTTVIATGKPKNNGSFSYDATAISGSVIASISLKKGETATANPSTSVLKAPAPIQGAPTAGGLGQYKVTYTVNGLVPTNDSADPFTAPTFGTSCYSTILESDWGTHPAHCEDLTYKGVLYSGIITNPYGYPGTYCSSFIEEIKLNGSGVLNSGTFIAYNNGVIASEPVLIGADQTPVVAGQTVARDRKVIAGRGVHLDLDGIGTNLLANDVGGQIKGYRIDLYKGIGDSVCTGYNNAMSVGACTPAQTTCPGSALQ